MKHDLSAENETWLLSLAEEASKVAYAPYSQFPVGAAILTKGGDVFSGCNIENASYGLAICAERVATFKAVSAGHSDFAGIAIYTPTPTSISPCGACRQVLYEFDPELQVVSGSLGGVVKRWTLSELLLDAFGPTQLS